MKEEIEMKKYKDKRGERIKKVLAAAMFVLLLTTSASAIRLNLTASGIPAQFTGPVELYRLVGSYDPPGGGDDVLTRIVVIDSSGNLTNTEVPIIVTPVASQPNIISFTSGGVADSMTTNNDIANGTYLYLRIWDGAAGQGHYYATAARTISWGPTDAKVDWDASSWPVYLADVPQNVGVRVDSESIQRSGTSQVLTLGISAINNGSVEIIAADTILQISKLDTFANVADATGGAKSFNSTSAVVSGDYFTSGTYYIRAQEHSYYGYSPTDLLTAPQKTISGPGSYIQDGVGVYTTLGGPPSGGGTAALTLESAAPAGPGMNFISMPFDGPWYAFGADGTTPLNVGLNDTNQITNAFHLVRVINAAARAQGTAGDVVSTFGTWDPGTQKADGVLISNYDAGSVQPALENIILKPVTGYQAYLGDISVIPARKISFVIKSTPQ
jgi:hypothetical protein